MIVIARNEGRVTWQSAWASNPTLKCWRFSVDSKLCAFGEITSAPNVALHSITDCHGVGTSRNDRRCAPYEIKKTLLAFPFSEGCELALWLLVPAPFDERYFGDVNVAL